MAVAPQTIAQIDRAAAELQRAIDALGSDEMFAAQLRFSASVVAAAIAEARIDINARQLRDLEFALHDVEGFTGELSAQAADELAPPLEALRRGVVELKSHVFVPHDVTAAAAALNLKLRERKTAIERQTFLPPGTPAPPLPHDPQQLAPEAAALRDAFVKAGFETPLLDGFLENPSGVRMKDLGDLIGEIETIVE